MVNKGQQKDKPSLSPSSKSWDPKTATQSYGTVVFSFSCYGTDNIKETHGFGIQWKKLFFGHATSIHRQKRVFYCTWLPSSGQVLQLFVQVPPNGPLNITCQKTRSPKKILTKYTKLVFTLFSARFQALQLIPNVFIEDCHSWTKPPDGGIGINQVDQLTHQVDDVTTDQLMTTPYRLY